MSYNALNFDGTSRLSDFQIVLGNSEPDILICQEIATEAGANAMLSVLNTAIGGYARAEFVFDGDLNNMLFYKASVASLVSQDTIGTSPRDISEYVMNIDGNTIRFYSCHLKSSDGSSNEQIRLEAVTALRDHLSELSEGTEFIIVGDMNFYTSSETGYQKFIADEVNNIGRAQDLCNQVGDWHDSYTFREVHTQSTRVEQFGYGAGGGLDDKFDFIFGNYGINNGSGIEYSSNSFTSYGNDGNHFNQSVNDGTNSAVPDSVADALYEASDHLPVYSNFVSLSGTQSYLFISEYIEGSSYNKAIEIYNGTGAAVDLSAYSLEKDLNGDEVWGNTYNYNATLADGDVFVLANSGAVQAILDVADDTDNWVINFNGNDQVRLLKYGIEIDRIGIPGDIDFAKDVTYVRKSTVTEPKSGPQDPRSNGEWDEYPINTFTYLGYHVMLNPQITVVSPNGSEEWERGETRNITWTSSDFTANVKIELLRDSTDTVVLVSSTQNDSLWQWTIPDTQEIENNYKIKISDAVDGVPSDESDSSFTISGIYRIYEIQTTADSLEGPSPYLGENVTISGIVTAITYNGYYLQDDIGAWNGIFIYDNTHFPSRCDSLIITGLVNEYNSLTELMYLTEYQLESSNNVLPDYILVSTGNIAQEKYEGVFVYVTNAECTNDNPDYPYDYGEWLVDDGSGEIRVDDQMHAYSPTEGVFYNITGVVNYTYSNFKIEPRYAEDICLFIPDTPENVQIEIIANGDSIRISWNNEGYEYKIYSCDDPYGSFNLLETTVTDTGQAILPVPVEAKKFYRITAE
ncbi:MAG: lamin tail domain-containing protein [Candidatus Cloacimonetes bacterium]|nr:lamin tail domain-containing protein [Candidatus Cloacimonadota bacterium]